jgi:hypothetical protein
MRRFFCHTVTRPGKRRIVAVVSVVVVVVSDVSTPIPSARGGLGFSYRPMTASRPQRRI